jgi:activating signal cointegrator complex subunit 3
LKNPLFESLYTKFNFFNPIQTQLFFSLYHTDNNILIGAPTGSGKTIMSELAILRLFSQTPDKKIVYVAPLKSLAKERLQDWIPRFDTLKKSVV